MYDDKQQVVKRNSW